MGRGTLTAILLVSAVICGETAFAQVQPGETLRDAGDQPSPEAESQRYGATRGRRNVMPPFGGSFAGGGLIGDDNGFVYTSSTPGGFVGTGGFIGTPFFGMGGGSWPYDARMTPYAPYGPGLSGFLSNIMNFASQAANYPIPHYGNGYGRFNFPNQNFASAGASTGTGFGGSGIATRFGGSGSGGGNGFHGVFASSSSSSSNVNGKTTSHKSATVGVNDNGKVKFYTYHDP